MSLLADAEKRAAAQCYAMLCTSSKMLLMVTSCRCHLPLRSLLASAGGSTQCKLLAQTC